MFESAEVGHKVAKRDFKKAVPKLRTALLQAQRALLDAQASVIIIVSGVEGAGRSEVVNRLTEWMDPRSLHTFAFWDETDEERSRPNEWRFWRTLPPTGRIHIFFGSWYTRPIIRRVFGQIEAHSFDKELHDIRQLEQMLVADRTHFVKLWFHLPKGAQAKRVAEKTSRKQQNLERVKALADGVKAKKGTDESVEEEDARQASTGEDSPTDAEAAVELSSQAVEFAKSYDDFVPVCARAIQLTDTAEAPWHIIEATNRRYRDLTAAQTVLSVLQQCVDGSADPPSEQTPPRTAATSQLTVLDPVDLTPKLDPSTYTDRLKACQARLHALAWAAYNGKRSLVALFEGWDAAGKGGAIRRFTHSLDARLFRVISIAAPSDEEKAQHYLWRFWRHIPTGGHVTVFDRSWYGRVLVERVEGFCTTAEWERAYSEINAFEERLTEHGIGLAKFWIHISKDEQLDRFEQRQQIPWKQHKITDEDWRNREKWDAYAEAIDEMVTRTSTGYGPWHLIPGNDKKFARVRVLEILCETFEAMLA